MTDLNSTARVENWSSFQDRDGNAFLMGRVVPNGRLLGDFPLLKLLEPVTYLNRASKLCQINGRLYRLGLESDRPRRRIKEIYKHLLDDWTVVNRNLRA